MLPDDVDDLWLSGPMDKALGPRYRANIGRVLKTNSPAIQGRNSTNFLSIPPRPGVCFRPEFSSMAWFLSLLLLYSLPYRLILGHIALIQA